MEKEELAARLKAVHERGIMNRDSTTKVTLFGIKYASELRQLMSRNRLSRTALLHEIAGLAGIEGDLEPALSTGMNLSEYVRLRSNFVDDNL